MSYYRLHLEPPGKDFIGEAYKSTMRVYKYVRKCEFSHGSYENSLIDRDKTIYADSPYINNKFKTKYFQGFDHEKFWNAMAKRDTIISKSDHQKTKRNGWRRIFTVWY